MTSNINSVAVLGAGTMGSGIAALAAEKNCKVLLLDISEEAAANSRDALLQGHNPALSDVSKKNNIEVGSFDKDFEKIKDFDWICEVVVEDIEIKQDIFKKIEEHKGSNTIVSSNTSGIPLREITKHSSIDLLKSVCVTHFFNPVKVMKLCELIPGEETSKDVIETLKNFLENIFSKGVVHGKDTVNFIGNRIGCFFLLKGLHTSSDLRSKGITVEQVDALMSKPMGLPPTGLYGLIDLIGLDVMHAVGLNLSKNLPKEFFHKAEYFINVKLLWNNGDFSLEEYLKIYPDSPFLLDAVNQLLAYFKYNNMLDKEQIYYSKYINVFSDDSWFLNQYSWRMSELGINLDDALRKVEHALKIFNKDTAGIANILDTKAELLWKLNRPDEALQTIQQAINIDPENQYYKDQKNKFSSKN